MKIICMTDNYASSGNSPAFFMKPDTALLRNNAPFYYPDFTEDLRCAVVLVLRINRLGRCIAPKFAHRYYNEIGIGIDFTAADIQRNCIASGLPWECCKAFDYSAPISPVFVPVETFADPLRIRFSLSCGDTLIQQGDTADMIFDFHKIIAFVSQFVMLKMGDLIFTGAMTAASAVKTGDVLAAYIEDKKMLVTEIR